MDRRGFFRGVLGAAAAAVAGKAAAWKEPDPKALYAQRVDGPSTEGWVQQLTEDVDAAFAPGGQGALLDPMLMDNPRWIAEEGALKQPATHEPGLVIDERPGAISEMLDDSARRRVSDGQAGLPDEGGWRAGGGSISERADEYRGRKDPPHVFTGGRPYGAREGGARPSH
ncbi:MAG: hypothetical protein HN396_10775 [Gemmatimonadales bacterium]|jgi:hypothetical protein|nr:hypothetical protein [Gemmatimonadales bacterium]